MAGSPEVSLQVRLRAGAPALRKLLTGVIIAVTSVLFIVGGSADPAGFGGILFILLGVAGLALCVAGGLVYAGQVTGRRPVLEFDDLGVRVPAVWPRSRRADRVLPWSELAAVCAWSQGPPAGGRNAPLIPHRLAFLPAPGLPAPEQAGNGHAENGQPEDSQSTGTQGADGQSGDGQGAGGQGAGGQGAGGQGGSGQGGSGQGAGGQGSDRQGSGQVGGGRRRTPPENGAELLAIKVAEVDCVPTLRWSVPIRPGWDITVEEIAKAVQNHRDDVPFIDRRELPKPRRKRRPTPRRSATDRATVPQPVSGKSSTGKPGIGKSSTGKSSTGKPGIGSSSTGKSGIGKSGIGKPGIGKSSTGTSSTGKPGVGEPSADTGRPDGADEP